MLALLACAAYLLEMRLPTPRRSAGLTQHQLDFLTGRASRDEGLKRAADRAGDSWMDAAVADFAAFVKLRGEATCEQWRHDWLTRGGAAPASHKAWGAVANTAARRGLVVNTRRYVQAVSKKTHCHPVPLWTSPA
jgi:hypothetical protein